MLDEYAALAGAILLGLVHIGAASLAFKRQVGNAYTVGARDAAVQPAGMAGRLARAQANFLETFPLFAAAVLMLAPLEAAGTLSSLGAQLYLGGRVLFLPAYASGLPWLRTVIWQVATLGLALVWFAVVGTLLVQWL